MLSNSADGLFLLARLTDVLTPMNHVKLSHPSLPTTEGSGADINIIRFLP